MSETEYKIIRPRISRSVERGEDGEVLVSGIDELDPESKCDSGDVFTSGVRKVIESDEVVENVLDVCGAVDAVVSQFHVIPRRGSFVSKGEVKIFDDGTYATVRKGVRAGFTGALKGYFRRMFLSEEGEVFEDPDSVAERDKRETDRVPDSEEARDTRPDLFPLGTLGDDDDTPITYVPPDNV